MDVQTEYVLVLDRTLANVRCRTRRKSVQRSVVNIDWKPLKKLSVRSNVTPAVNDLDKFFALDSSANTLHSGITS